MLLLGTHRRLLLRQHLYRWRAVSKREPWSQLLLISQTIDENRRRTQIKRRIVSEDMARNRVNAMLRRGVSSNNGSHLSPRFCFSPARIVHPFNNPAADVPVHWLSHRQTTKANNDDLQSSLPPLLHSSSGRNIPENPPQQNLLPIDSYGWPHCAPRWGNDIQKRNYH